MASKRKESRLPSWWSFEDVCSECRTGEELNKHVVPLKASLISCTDQIELKPISEKLLTSLIDDSQVGAA